MRRNQDEPVTREQFASDLIERLDAKAQRSNLIAMVVWMTAENTAAKFNPLATTKKMPGSHDFGSQTALPVQSYVDLDQGLEATWLTITLPYYRKVVRLLKRNARPTRILEAVQESPWAGANGYPEGLLQALEKSVTGDYEEYANRPIGQ